MRGHETQIVPFNRVRPIVAVRSFQAAHVRSPGMDQCRSKPLACYGMQRSVVAGVGAGLRVEPGEPVVASHPTDISSFLTTACKNHDQEQKPQKSFVVLEAAQAARQQLTFYRCEERKPSRRNNQIVRTSLPLLRSRKQA